MTSTAVLRCLLTGLVLTLAAGSASAQRRLRSGLETLTDLQVDYALRSGDYVWGRFASQHAIGRSYGSSYFVYNQALVGYEHFWSDSWSGGLNAAAFVYEEVFNNRLRATLAPEVLLRHRSQALGLTWGQRLGLSYSLLPEPQRNTGVASLRLDVERLLPVGPRLKLRPRLAFEAGTALRIQPPDDAPDERTIDYTQLRAEVGIRLSDRLDLTPYFARQTQYILALEQFSPTGEPLPAGRTNIVTPAVGLDLRLTLFQGGQPFERRQLPTQH
ncbi:hypothetical protein [Hymenobacter sp. B81]|uniref:hypothetical protein n=1 Tax=Hymenobacter sp. B81 TaxID=3344878 RepID=UPI0037DD1519